MLTNIPSEWSYTISILMENSDASIIQGFHRSLYCQHFFFKTKHWGGRGSWISEFETSLVYRVSPGQPGLQRNHLKSQQTCDGSTHVAALTSPTPVPGDALSARDSVGTRHTDSTYRHTGKHFSTYTKMEGTRKYGFSCLWATYCQASESPGF